nr:hypothetical protein [Mucilaginibacter sp. L294]
MEENSVLQIDIVGNRYHIDSSMNLIPVDKDLSIIQVGELDIAIDHEWERHGYYDLLNKCLYIPPENLKDLPEGIVAFSIPSDRELLESKHTILVIYAEIVDLKESRLKEEVDENNLDSMEEVKKPNDKVFSRETNQIEKEEQKEQPKKKRGRHL